jgi:Adenylate and Guanylate cyclase catalytic domain
MWASASIASDRSGPSSFSLLASALRLSRRCPRTFSVPRSGRSVFVKHSTPCTGDDRWRALLENHNELVRRQLAAFDGREVKMLGDGFLASFDGPGRAIRCACAIREDVDSLGVDVRAGVHTGECEVMGADMGGMAVHIGARVVARAAPGEVLVSSAVRDLVVGSGIEFADRGTHELKGVPGEWRLLAVAGARTDGEPTEARKAEGDSLAPNATLVTKGDRAALRLARRAPGAVRLLSRALSRRARPQETHT